MSSLAGIAQHLGYEIQGSDIGYPSNSSILPQSSIKKTHEKDGWRPAEIVVYSSAIPSSNPELVSARDALNEGVLVLHRSEFLQKIISQFKPIVITGTHGKSTTSAILTHLLDDLNQDPLSAIGASMIRYKAPYRYGNGEFFIVEADESDGSFLNYNPFVGVITNIDIDHLDHYGNINNVVAAFDSFIDRVAFDGFNALFWDNQYCRELFRKKQSQFVTYGLSIGSELRALDIKFQGMMTEFTAIVARDRFKVKIPLFGVHNVLNCLSALSVVYGLKLDVEQAIKSLANFQGVQRRLNLIFENERIRIFDDYAHNPGKISACIKSLKEAFPNEPVVVVFQPHRYSRLATMYIPMLEALKSADYIITVPVFSAGESEDPQYTPERIASDIRNLCKIKAIPVSSLDMIPTKINDLNLSKLTVLTCGAGNINLVGSKIAEVYKQ
jgi:UDP-N-acetylmuramate--alanine ligase